MPIKPLQLHYLSPKLIESLPEYTVLGNPTLTACEIFKIGQYSTFASENDIKLLRRYYAAPKFYFIRDDPDDITIPIFLIFPDRSRTFVTAEKNYGMNNFTLDAPEIFDEKYVCRFIKIHNKAFLGSVISVKLPGF